MRTSSACSRALRSVLLLHLQELALADREGHIHRVPADDHGQRAAVRADDVALGQLGAADLAGDRRGDLGVAEVDVGGLQVGIGDDDLALRASSRSPTRSSSSAREAASVFTSSCVRARCAVALAKFPCAFSSAPCACCTAAWKVSGSMR